MLAPAPSTISSPTGPSGSNYGVLSITRQNINDLGNVIALAQADDEQAKSQEEAGRFNHTAKPCNLAVPLLKLRPTLVRVLRSQRLSQPSGELARFVYAEVDDHFIHFRLMIRE